MSFSKKYTDKNLPNQLDTGSNQHRHVHISDQLNNFPPELRPTIEIMEVKQSFNKLLEYIRTIHDRLDHVEIFLNMADFEQKILTLEQRAHNLEQKMDKVLTHPNDLALQLTSDKAEVRRIAEEVVKIKQAIGVASGA